MFRADGPLLKFHLISCIARRLSSKYMIKYIAVAVAVAVSGGGAVAVAVAVAGLTKRFFNHIQVSTIGSSPYL